MEEIARPIEKASSESKSEMQIFLGKMDRPRRNIGQKYGRGIVTMTGCKPKTLTTS